MLFLLLMLLSCFSRVTPEMAAHQALPSLGFSRQEQWSGLPFPSPKHESGKWKVKVKSLGRVQLLATPWTAAYQAPPAMRFSRQEYSSWVPLPSPFQLYLYLKAAPEIEWFLVHFNTQNPCYKRRDFHLVYCFVNIMQKIINVDVYGIPFM